MKKLVIFIFTTVLAHALGAQTFSNGTNAAIPDNNLVTGATSVINVSGLATSLNCTSLGLQSVCVKIAHTYDADLEIYLVAPDGTVLDLSSDNGGAGDHYGNNTADDLGPYTCFDMAAATAVTAGAAPFAGSFRPEGHLGAVNNGQNPNGNWTLRVFDDLGGDVGTLLYWQLTFASSSIPCAAYMTNTTSTNCSGNFYDNGGPSINYSNNQNTVRTICPTAGSCMRLTVNSFAIENGYDYLYVYDGNSTIYGQFAGSPYTGATIPASFTATTSIPTGCITFQFISDGVGTNTGWNMSMSCVACAAPPAPSSQDCSTGSTQVCSNASFSGNSSGSGSIGDLNPTNRGCLFEENNSSWYYINIGTTGTLQFTLTPSNGSDDYDFALWGPTTVCPPQSAPIRCNYAAHPRVAGCGTNTNPTGLNGTSTFTTAAACDDRPFLQQVNVTAGEVYILLVDGYNASAQPFTLSWGGTSSLSCTPVTLPVELLSFTGKSEKDRNSLYWTTATEVNNDFFMLERSADGINWKEFAQVDGAGTTTMEHSYSYVDNQPYPGTTYYRLRQQDFNGEYHYSEVVALQQDTNPLQIVDVRPNPASSGTVARIYSSSDQQVTLNLLDHTGRVVQKMSTMVQAGENAFEIQLETLPSGLYTIQVGGVNGTSSARIVHR